MQNSTSTVSIPRREIVHHESDMPNCYSETPNGTIFSTTPGGTRIIYERRYLLNLKSSPLSKTPSKELPVIPGVTLDNNGVLIKEDDDIYSIQEEQEDANTANNCSGDEQEEKRDAGKPSPSASDDGENEMFRFDEEM